MSELDNVTPTKITLTTKQYQKINRAVKALNDVRKELEPQCKLPGGINWYLEDTGNLCLMDGDTHCDGLQAKPRRNGVIEVFYLDNASGGGW